MDHLRSELTPHRCEGARAGALAALAALLLGFTLACGAPDPPPDPAPDIPLHHTVASPDALGREVLSAIALRNRGRLEELALSETEFVQVVWPLLPASRREVGMPVDYAWNDLRLKSAVGLDDTLEAVGGTRFALVDLRFAGETTDYGEFRVHREAVLEVRDESGVTKHIRVFGSMIEYGGRVKVYSYVVD